MKRKSAKKIVKNNVVLCEKRIEKNSIFIWVVDNPEIRAEAKKLSQAEDKLVNTIWDIFELDEPFAIKYNDADLTAIRSENQLFWVGSNDVIDTTNPSQYFTGGFCQTCQSGIGGRNGKILTIE